MPPKLKEICGEIDRHGIRYWLIGALTEAFLEARRGKLRTLNEHSYDVRWLENINNLAEAIITRIYTPGGSVSFVVYDPKVREIFAAPFVDRIIHHLLHALQGDWWEERFIDDSYSCRIDKGSSYGIKRAHKLMRLASDNFTKPAYIIKLDLKSYFMSLPRQKLYETVHEGLLGQFAPYFQENPHSNAIYELYRICDFLWKQVLLDDPVPKSHKRPPLSNWNDVPKGKSLEDQPPGHGIVIGNQTSQLVSNIYLNKLDHFVVDELGYSYYGRYVDDFFIIVPESQYTQAKRDIAVIERYVSEELGLTLHPTKRYYQSIYKGVSFLGARIYPHCIFPSDRLQSKMDHLLYQITHGQNVPDATLSSYFGMYKNLNAHKYMKKLFHKHGLDYRIYLDMMNPNGRPWKESIAMLKNNAKQKCQR